MQRPDGACITNGETPKVRSEGVNLKVCCWSGDSALRATFVREGHERDVGFYSEYRDATQTGVVQPK